MRWISEFSQKVRRAGQASLVSPVVHTFIWAIRGEMIAYYTSRVQISQSTQ